MSSGLSANGFLFLVPVYRCSHAVRTDNKRVLRWGTKLRGLPCRQDCQQVGSGF